MSYYAVIFSSKRTSHDQDGYEEMAERMVDLARLQKGFLGVESVRDSNGYGITVSYWQTLDDIRSWKAHQDHMIAQKMGRERWYSSFQVKICKIEQEY